MRCLVPGPEMIQRRGNTGLSGREKEAVGGLNSGGVGLHMKGVPLGKVRGCWKVVGPG